MCQSVKTRYWIRLQILLACVVFAALHTLL